MCFTQNKCVHVKIYLFNVIRHHYHTTEISIDDRQRQYKRSNMKVLVIGGTADGRKLANNLYQLGFDIRYSIAGIVRKGKLACPIISGGFTQFGGLQQYVLDNQITHLVDVTDPFAEKMSNKIALVSEQLSIPALRCHRQPWHQTECDQWIDITQWPEVMDKLKNGSSLLISAGQIQQTVLDQLAGQAKKILLRTAMPVKINLADNVTWIKASGPFLLEHEKKLLEQHNIDAIISKNSGGESTYAKMKAAAEATIPVYQFRRPELRPTMYQFDNIQDCVDMLCTFKARYI